MTFRTVTDWTAGFIIFFSLVRYAQAVWKTRALPPGAVAKVEPKRVTWIIYCILDIEAFIELWLTHDLNGQITGVIFGLPFAFFTAMKYGKWELGKGWWKYYEIGVLTGAIVAAAVIAFNPHYGLAISLPFFVLGSLPTFKSAYDNPAAEPWKAWAIQLSSCGVVMLGLIGLSFESFAQPLTFTVVQGTVIFLTRIRPRLFQTAVQA